ncbi:MAG TPA: hybrid sensor histidine kinase/response regulator [Planctomycetota bacterium]|jgi:signal transduction histidine kinase/CheY-like chemotaxis protein
MRNVLLIDPDPRLLSKTRQIVCTAEPAATVTSAAAFEDSLRSGSVDLILWQHRTVDPAWTTLRQLRKACDVTPIIAAFTAEQQSNAPAALQNGATDFVLLSDDLEPALIAAIKRCSEVAALHERLSRAEAECTRLKQIEEARTAFLSAVTHELRTPLVGLRIYSQFLSSGRLGPMSAAQTDKVEAIFRNAERLTHCVESIQRYQRLEARRLEWAPSVFDLRTVLCEAITTATRACMEKGITLGQSWPLEPLYVYADRELILEVINNLVENAITFTAPKESVNLSVVRRGDEGVRVAITDSGCGIDPQKLAHLFDAADGGIVRWERGAGFGLGLAIVKRILDVHSSKIEIVSQPGSGTRVSFTLPLARQPAAGSTPHEEQVEPDRRRRVILVVDDDEDNLASTRSVVEYAGYQVLGASSFEEARTQLNDAQVDAVLLDIAMKGADGLQTLQNLKHCPATSSVPVIMVSAEADDAVRVQASRLGAAGFVVKPFTPAKLLREINTAISTPAAACSL